jgi:hypothetical protein
VCTAVPARTECLFAERPALHHTALLTHIKHCHHIPVLKAGGDEGTTYA